MAGVVITSNARIGDHVCILPNTVIHHDVTVGDWCTDRLQRRRSPAASSIGENCYIGSGTQHHERRTHRRRRAGRPRQQRHPRRGAGTTVAGNPAALRSATRDMIMNIDGAKILVTGGCGLIGSTTIDLLLREHAPARIVILDNLVRGTLANVEHALKDPRVTLVARRHPRRGRRAQGRRRAWTPSSTWPRCASPPAPPSRARRWK